MHTYTHVYVLNLHIPLRIYANANVYNVTGRYLYFPRRQDHPPHHTKEQPTNPFTVYFKHEDVAHCPIYLAEYFCWVTQICS